MLESTANSENEIKCPRCGKVVDNVDAIWSIKIDEVLRSVHVCQECWKTLDAVRRKLALAGDAFIRMVYECPGHEKIAPFVVGHVVMTVRRSRDKELAKFGWEDARPTDVLVLSSGAIVVPAADEERNEVGALFGLDNENQVFEFEYNKEGPNNDGRRLRPNTV